MQQRPPIVPDSITTGRRGREASVESRHGRRQSCYRGPVEEAEMPAEGPSVRVEVEWQPEVDRPGDVDRWQRVIDSAYAGGYGRVRLVRQDEGRWKVTSATTMMRTRSTEADTLPMSKAMREAVKAALRARGFPVL